MYGNPDPQCALDIGRRKIAENADKVAVDEMNTALRQLRYETQRAEEYRNWAFAMQREWPNDTKVKCPRLEQFQKKD